MVFQSNMLFKKDFKTVFESCKCAITKNGVLVGKGYIFDVLFKHDISYENTNK